MTELTNITFNVKSTDKPLKLEVNFDSEVVFDQSIDNTGHPVKISIDDEVEGSHTLEFTMKGKTVDHTTVDENGNILEDSELVFSDIEVDGINIEELFWFQAEYSHDFNGTGELTVENFYGSMGCNGTVEIDIITPMYMWLLENI